MTDFFRELARERLLVIIRGTDPEAAIAAGRTLIGSGIRFLEVSLVTTDALRVISELARLASDDAVIGAGTVLTHDDVDRAADAGARFMVTPAVTESVAESVARGIPVLAGALTPTEVLTAMDLGATAAQAFPGRPRRPLLPARVARPTARRAVRPGGRSRHRTRRRLPRGRRRRGRSGQSPGRGCRSWR